MAFQQSTKFAYGEMKAKGQAKFSKVEVRVDKDFECGGKANFMADSLASLGRARSLGNKRSLPAGHKNSQGREIRLDASLNERDGAWLHILESLHKMDSVVVKALYTVSVASIVSNGLYHYERERCSHSPGVVGFSEWALSRRAYILQRKIRKMRIVTMKRNTREPNTPATIIMVL